MLKDTKSLGNNKAPACESRGFVRKKQKVCILTHLLLFSTKELYSQLSLGPVFLFWSVAYSQLFLKLFKFILNHSSIGIPSMHNRNFPFFCGFLFTVAVEYAVPDFSRCSRECSFP